MILTLLALVLLASLLFYVMNLGRQAQTRLETQAAADAAAAAGSGWVARSFNAVAMNNVGIARMIALVNVMDAMPMAVAFSLEDQQAIARATRSQLARGVAGAWVRDGLQRFADEIDQEIAQLEPMDRLLNHSGYDIRTMTFYDVPGGGGRTGDLWRAMHAMDAHSQATMETLGPLTQANAVQGGRVNLAGAEATALVVAADPIAWNRGRFDDFERPVRYGLLPHGTDDKLTNRGPYDVLFGWRDPVLGERDGYFDGSRRNAGGGRPGVPIGRGPDQDTFIETSRTPEKYRVYGPLRHMFYALSSMARQNLPHSRFSDYYYAPPNRYWINTLARIKLGYLWPGGPTEKVIDPQWTTSFASAVMLAENERRRIRETAFVVVEVKSRYPRNDPRFMSPGSWSYVTEDEPYYRPSPRVVWLNGWVDPRDWTGAGISQVGDYIWRDEWSYNSYYDTQIGVEEDPYGGTQRVFRIDDYIFAGVNVGDEVPVRNPHNFGSRRDLPAPIDLDRQAVGHDEASRRQYLTFLGVARRSNRAMLWSEGFDGSRKYPNHVAIAQATVFNNHSWDLWTQMWYAQNERVEHYEDWVGRLNAMVDAGVAVPDLNMDDVAELRTQLQDLAPLAPIMLGH